MKKILIILSISAYVFAAPKVSLEQSAMNLKTILTVTTVKKRKQN
jgi:hypothetical protein